MALPFLSRRRGSLHSFTLLEILVVIAVIAILAALTFAAGEAVLTTAARSRANSEIQAMSSALESYKADNGIYPWTNNAGQTTFTSTNDYQQNPPPNSIDYTVSAQVLYEGLSGKVNYEDTPASPPTNKYYMVFKINQLGNANTAGDSGYSASLSGGSTYVQDPFNNPYGYYASPDTNNPPLNGTGFFDMWTTAGATNNPSAVNSWTNTWISNWSH